MAQQTKTQSSDSQPQGKRQQSQDPFAQNRPEVVERVRQLIRQSKDRDNKLLKAPLASRHKM